MQFASVFGVIREVKYFDSYKSKYCLWCSQGNEIFEATLKETPFSENEVKNDADHKWSDTFTKPPNIDEDEVLRFPDVSFDLPEDEQVTGFGVKGEIKSLYSHFLKDYIGLIMAVSNECPNHSTPEILF